MSATPVKSWLMKTGPAELVQPDAERIVRGVLELLAGLHRSGLIHGGITLESVTVDAALQPALPALGPYCVLGATRSQQEFVPPELRHAMPLELPRPIDEARTRLESLGLSIDPVRVDLYQVGALLCRMVTGESVDAFLRSPRVVTSLPRRLRELVDRALSTGSNGFSDVQAFLTGLDELETVDTEDRQEPRSESPTISPAADDTASVPSLGATLFTGELAVPAGDEELPFARLGHYEIVRRLGQGGMGEVYLGYEQALDRRVAIKVLPVELARHPDLVARFRAEATAAARINHPHVVQIHFIGEDQGRNFFAMQFVDGGTLNDILRRTRKLPLEEALLLAEHVLLGLAAAHRHGLIHRDIKPGNILLDRAAGRALLADFGLVKSLEESVGARTASGVILGTVDYLSPEQGSGKRVDVRSDLYSCGVLLFRILAGRLPFLADSLTGQIYQHVHEPPPDLRELAPEVPAPVAAVVSRLLAKRPEDRFATADDVLLAIRACASTERDAGEVLSSLLEADPAPAGPAKISRRAIVLGAGATVAGGLAAAFLLSPSRATQGPFAAPATSDGVRQFLGHTDSVTSIDVTPDGRFLLSGSRNGIVRYWDIATGLSLQEIRADQTAEVRRVLFAPDPRYGFSCGANQIIRKWDLTTKRQVTQCNGHTAAIACISLVPGKDQIVSSSFDCSLMLWDTIKGERIRRFGYTQDELTRMDETSVPELSERKGHVTWIRTVVALVDGLHMISGGNDAVLIKWNLETGEILGRWREHRGPIMSLALSADGTRILSGGFDKVVILWDTASGEPLQRFEIPGGTPASVAFSPDGRTAAAGAQDSLIHRFDLESGTELEPLEGHAGLVTCLKFLPAGEQLLSGSEDQSIRMWGLSAGSS